MLGGWAYAIVLPLNTRFNRVRRRPEFSWRVLSARLEGKVTSAVQFIYSFAESTRRLEHSALASDLQAAGEAVAA